jgi:hypothetical protein
MEDVMRGAAQRLADLALVGVQPGDWIPSDHYRQRVVERGFPERQFLPILLESPEKHWTEDTRGLVCKIDVWHPHWGWWRIVIGPEANRNVSATGWLLITVYRVDMHRIRTTPHYQAAA